MRKQKANNTPEQYCKRYMMQDYGEDRMYRAIGVLILIVLAVLIYYNIFAEKL